MYKNLSDNALLDMMFVASLREDKTEYEELEAELNRRLSKKNEKDEDFYF